MVWQLLMEVCHMVLHNAYSSVLYTMLTGFSAATAANTDLCFYSPFHWLTVDVSN